ncbi:hypothetical protein NDU88_003685 [Pleurodeles waltl]|uniref:Uncharacterized protein n=1 Tax=Pleurodeles waltl TaxID=8319 RepID=A0AAV7W879_PLEWA|nr:hypothetical protein NDU88_003685 [Pleurodeles waltl]
MRCRGGGECDPSPHRYSVRGIPGAAAPDGAGTSAVQTPQLREHLPSRQPRCTRAAPGLITIFQRHGGGRSKWLRNRPVRAVRSGNQPGREPRGPEIPSAAAVCRAARRRGPHEAQLCSGNSATGDGARASAPPKSDPRDARLPNADASQLPTMPFHFSAER